MAGVGKRALVASMLDRIGITGALLATRRMIPGSRGLPVLVYHSVREIDASYPFDAGVVDATPSQFDAQMAVLAKYFKPLGTDDLIRFRQGEPVPSNGIVVSFDDGYRNVYTTALPILAKHGIKAMFFIAPWFLDERRIFWWDRIAYTLKTSTRARVKIEYPRAIELPLGAGLERSLKEALHLVKEEKGLDLDRFLDGLADAAGVAWDRDKERALADEMLLTWDQVRAIKAAGHDVESHTHTHRVLQTLTVDEARAELEGSRRELEARLSSPVRAVSYPCGYAIDRAPDISAEVERAGYALGFSAMGGLPRPSDWKDRPLHLVRVCMDYDMPLPFFRGILAIPKLAW